MWISMHWKICRAVLIALFCTVSVIFIVWIVPTEVNYPDLKITEKGLLAVLSQTNTTTQLATYRLSDGKTETISGSWRTIYGSPSELIALGTRPEEPNSQYLLNLSTTSGVIKDISGLPGQILDLTISPDNNWILITGIKAEEPNKRYICVVSKNDSNLANCKLIPGTILPEPEKAGTRQYTAYWDTTTPNSLFIRSLDGSPDIGWKFMPEKNTITKLEKLPSLLPETPKNPLTITRFGPIVSIKNLVKPDSKRSFHWISPKSTIIPVTDMTLAVQQENTISILDRKKNYLAKLEIFSAEDSNKSTVTGVFTFYNQQPRAQ